MLLNGTPFAFVIDLAALASRREYLKLDKWLTDKIREHGVSLRTGLWVIRGVDSHFPQNVNDVFVVGAFYPGLRDVSEEALPVHYGGSGSRQGPAQKCPAAPRDINHHADLFEVLCWVRRSDTFRETLHLSY